MRASRPTLGVNFSHRHAEWLGLDPDDLYRALLDDLGVRHVRISVYWDEIAPTPAALELGSLRRWLDPLQARGAKALVTVGLKAQRWPEYYPPTWLTSSMPMAHGADVEQHPRVVAHLLLMLERVTAYLADYDAVGAWQVENEPFLPSMRHTEAWQISPSLLAREIEVVRGSDPRSRPIVVNHSTQSRFDRRWWTALRSADRLAENIYTRKPNRWPWPRYFNLYALPVYRPALGRESRVARDLGKGLWITELQAEPWQRDDIKTLRPEQVESISPERIRRNLALVHRAGASHVYLWGAEWWQYTAQQHGDTRYWDLARSLFQSS